MLMPDSSRIQRMKARPPEVLHVPLPEPKLKTYPMETKPALQSSTVKAGLTLVLITLWPAFVAAATAVSTLLGMDVNAEAWLPYAEDGAVQAAEWFAIVQDLALPIIGLLVIRFRKQATTIVSGWFKADAA